MVKANRSRHWCQPIRAEDRGTQEVHALSFRDAAEPLLSEPLRAEVASQWAEPKITGVSTVSPANEALVHALDLWGRLLDETLERNAIYLRESDFCRDLGQWRGKWIVISADFAELDSSEGCQLLRHTSAHMNATNTGTCTFFFRPKIEVRKKLHDLSQEWDGLQEYLETITIDDYEPVMTGRARGDFLDDQVYDACAGDAAADSALLLKTTSGS